MDANAGRSGDWCLLKRRAVNRHAVHCSGVGNSEVRWFGMRSRKPGAPIPRLLTTNRGGEGLARVGEGDHGAHGNPDVDNGG